MLNSSYAILYQEGLLMYSSVKMTAEFRKMGAIVWKFIPKAPWHHQLSIWQLIICQMLITSLLNGIKSWNMAFRLILGCRIRLCSQKYHIFEIGAHLWRRVVHLDPDYHRLSFRILASLLQKYTCPVHRKKFEISCPGYRTGNFFFTFFFVKHACRLHNFTVSKHIIQHCHVIIQKLGHNNNAGDILGKIIL